MARVERIGAYVANARVNGLSHVHPWFEPFVVVSDVVHAGRAEVLDDVVDAIAVVPGSVGGVSALVVLVR